MNELVSIIMPTYKREFFLERALKSLINQTYKDLEIIVIDDNAEFAGIRKKVEGIIEKYSSDKRIKYIQNDKNLGGALSRNIGIGVAKGKYIAFLDDDDEYELDKIEKQNFYYKKKFLESEGILYSQEASYDKYGNKISATKNFINGNKKAFFEQMKGNIATTGNWFIPKKILEEVKGFKKLDCGQEWYLILKILDRGYDCACMKDELLKYYEHEQERITTNYEKKYKGEKKLYDIKKEFLSRFSKEEQKKIHYEVNIMLANYAIKIGKKEVIKHLREAKKFSRLKFKDVVKILLKLNINDNNYNKIKRIFS